jgi:hypothetical protein
LAIIVLKLALVKCKREEIQRYNPACRQLGFPARNLGNLRCRSDPAAAPGPLERIAAESYLSIVGVTSANPMPWITFYAAILKPNIILLWIVAIAWFYTLINLAQTYFFYCSRIIFAWSFDRLIPEKVSYIHLGPAGGKTQETGYY